MKNEIAKKVLSKNSVTMYIVVAAYAVLSALIYGDMASRQLSSMVISVSCYVVLAVSLNLVVGFLGELSLGHASFMSIGLFSGCLFSLATVDTMPMEIRLPLAMVVGGIFAAIVGLIVGLPALRLRGDYLAIVTLACGEIINNVITNLKFTGGALGLNTEPIYSKTKSLLPYAILLVVITVVVMMNIGRSKVGRSIMAIRDNRIAAESVGINVTYYKLLAFVLAAFFAGMAGTLYGHSLANIKATTFDYNMSIEILVIVVLGGMGSIRGSIIAAVILRTLPEILRDFSDYRMLVYSVLLILIMIFNNNPKFTEWKRRLSPKAFLKRRAEGRNREEERQNGQQN